MFVLSLLVGGGFLIGQQPDTAQAVTTFTQVFEDNFDRPDGAVGNGWEMTGSSTGDWSIVNGAAVTTPGTRWSKELLRPASEAIQDGKISFEIPASINKGATLAWGVYGRINQSSDGKYNAYGMYIFPSSRQVRIAKFVGISALDFDSNGGTQFVNDNGISGLNPVSNLARVEMEIVSANATTTNITANFFNNSDALVYTVTVSDSEPNLQTAGRWGLEGFSNTGVSVTSDFDNVKIYTADAPAAVDLTMTANKEDIKFGSNITYTLSDDEEQTVTLTDNGAGGSFSPSATVTLNASNSYTADVVYTPSRAGSFDILATADNFSEQLESNIFVSPYSTAIGFIGDSITDGNRCSSGNYPSTVAVNELGAGFTSVKQGVSGATSVSYLANNLTNAIAQFNANGIEIVHIMLGTNDSKAEESAITPEVYKTSLQEIINSLHTAGIKKVIISNPVTAYPGNNAVALAKLALLTATIDDLVDGETVLRGDTEAFQYFQTNMATVSCDDVHPNQAGNVQLGTFWANAIRANLEYQIAPDHEWNESDSEFTLGETGTLTYTIDKYIDEFADVVKVDGVALDADDYTATAGSTVIELSNAFLNTLTAGNHTLSVGFYGGVSVNSQFTVVAAANNTCSNGATNYPDCDDNTGGGSGGTDNPGNSNNPNNPVDPNNPNNPDDSNNPEVPDTGLFGMDGGAAGSLITVIASAVILGGVLVGRKLMARR